MAEQPVVVVHFKELSMESEIRETVEKRIQRRCEELGREFHEFSRCEISLAEDGKGFVAHGHATGRGTDVATHANANDPAPAADQVLDKIERQLRKVHDKRIFSQRRDAQRDPPKRKV